METERTTAPWTEPRCYPGRVKGHVERIAIYGNNGRTLVHDYRPLSGLGFGEALANAHLIYAAPELLEAAKLAIDHWHSNARNFERAEPEYLTACRSALAKAEGQAAVTSS